MYKNKIDEARDSLVVSKSAEHLFSSYHLQGDLFGVCQHGCPSKAKSLAVPVPAEATEAFSLLRVPQCEVPQIKQVLSEGIIQIYQLSLNLLIN